MPDSSERAERLRLPPGLSPEEEATWWDEHEEYWDSLDTEWEVVHPQGVRRTEEVTLWLPTDLMDAVREESNRVNLGPSLVITHWLDERLAVDQKRAKRPKAKSRVAEERPGP